MSHNQLCKQANKNESFLRASVIDSNCSRDLKMFYLSLFHFRDRSKTFYFEKNLPGEDDKEGATWSRFVFLLVKARWVNGHPFINTDDGNDQRRKENNWHQRIRVGKKQGVNNHQALQRETIKDRFHFDLFYSMECNWPNTPFHYFRIKQPAGCINRTKIVSIFLHQLAQKWVHPYCCTSFF